MTLPTYSSGGRIAFQSDRDGNSEIYVMGCDGLSQVNLTNHSAVDRQPSWARGGKVAFSSNRNSGGGFDIYLLTLDPWGIERLTTNAADDEFPSLSPDGSKVAFVSQRDGNSEIYLLDISGETRTPSRLTNNSAEDSDPAWKRDGSGLVFASNRSGNWDIYRMDSDGSSLAKWTIVSDDVGNDRSPALGEYFGDEVVAFASDRDGDWEIYVYDEFDGFRATTDLRRGEVDSSPSWGPSGDEFVFHTNRDAGGNYEVYRAANSFGDSRKNITLDGNISSSSSNETHPDWEPVVVNGEGYCGE